MITNLGNIGSTNPHLLGGLSLGLSGFDHCNMKHKAKYDKGMTNRIRFLKLHYETRSCQQQKEDH